MERIQIIKELASYVHPDMYYSILGWKTEHLKKLLDCCKGEVKEESSVKVTIEVLCRCAEKKGEPLKKVQKFNH